MIRQCLGSHSELLFILTSAAVLQCVNLASLNCISKDCSYNFWIGKVISGILQGCYRQREHIVDTLLLIDSPHSSKAAARHCRGSVFP